MKNLRNLLFMAAGLIIFSHSEIKSMESVSSPGKDLSFSSDSTEFRDEASPYKKSRSEVGTPSDDAESHDEYKIPKAPLSPLSVAIFDGNERAVRGLLFAGVKKNWWGGIASVETLTKRDSRGRSILHDAVSAGHPEILKLVLEFCYANVGDDFLKEQLLARDNAGNGLLHGEIVQSIDGKVYALVTKPIGELVIKWAKICGVWPQLLQQKNEIKESILYGAFYCADEEWLKYLVDELKEFSDDFQKLFFADKNQFGETLLHQVARSGNKAIFDLLNSRITELLSDKEYEEFIFAECETSEEGISSNAFLIALDCNNTDVSALLAEIMKDIRARSEKGSGGVVELDAFSSAVN